MTRDNATARPEPRLYLVTPPVAEPAAILADLTAALDAADVAAVLLRLADADERTLINRIKAIADVAQPRGAALLLRGQAGIVARSGADGAHLPGIEAFTAAVPALKPDRIAGCGGLKTRHDAMLAAETGADYVMFGEPSEDGWRPALDTVLERVEWWAEVFQVPCVAYAASLDEIEPLTRAGAEFVAVGDAVWNDTRGMAAAVTDAAQRLSVAEPVA